MVLPYSDITYHTSVVQLHTEVYNSFQTKDIRLLGDETMGRFRIHVTWSSMFLLTQGNTSLAKLQPYVGPTLTDSVNRYKPSEVDGFGNSWSTGYKGLSFRNDLVAKSTASGTCQDREKRAPTEAY
jgi:hypothetical protein